jgi:dTDP-4-dehydrorhamnose 3,5-epimerase
MRIDTTSISGLMAIRLDRFVDERGSFARLYCRDTFAAAGLETEFVQDSLSVTDLAGTLRGMHFQTEPFAEVKLIRCVRGAIFDVIVDLRPTSPTYHQWQGFTLSAQGELALYVPQGCAHGYQTITDDTEVLYQISAPYSPDHAAGFRFDDKAVGINWPVTPTVIAQKDLAWPALPHTSLPRRGS